MISNVFVKKEEVAANCQPDGDGRTAGRRQSERTGKKNRKRRRKKGGGGMAGKI
jgi:hypothetical protein